MIGRLKAEAEVRAGGKAEAEAEADTETVLIPKGFHSAAATRHRAVLDETYLISKSAC